MKVGDSTNTGPPTRLVKRKRRGVAKKRRLDKRTGEIERREEEINGEIEREKKDRSNENEKEIWREAIRMRDKGRD